MLALLRLGVVWGWKAQQLERDAELIHKSDCPYSHNPICTAFDHSCRIGRQPPLHVQKNPHENHRFMVFSSVRALEVGI